MRGRTELGWWRRRATRRGIQEASSDRRQPRRERGSHTFEGLIKQEHTGAYGQRTSECHEFLLTTREQQRASLAHAVFVAKSEVRSWPVFSSGINTRL